MIYLDFAKALDEVDHDLLRHKLKKLAIGSNGGVFIHSFFSDRTQFVRIIGGASEDWTAVSGVPHAPCYFILFCL